MKSLLAHVRGNAIAYAALFAALGGTAYAVSKVGPGDIERDAVRAKHLHERSVGTRLGSSVYFGQALDFGPEPANVGSSLGVPFLGQDDVDSAATSDGGAGVLLAPVPLRFRDLRMTTLDPVARPVWLTAAISDEFVPVPLLRCAIKAGSRSCRKRGPGKVLPAGERGVLILETPIRPQPLGEHDFSYSLRIVPR